MVRAPGRRVGEAENFDAGGRGQVLLGGERLCQAHMHDAAIPDPGCHGSGQGGSASLANHTALYKVGHVVPTFEPTQDAMVAARGETPRRNPSVEHRANTSSSDELWTYFSHSLQVVDDIVNVSLRSFR